MRFSFIALAVSVLIAILISSLIGYEDISNAIAKFVKRNRRP